MTDRPPILAATDLSDAADEALRQGRAFAFDLGEPFVVCHVLPETYQVQVLFPQDAGIDAAAEATIEKKAEAAVRDRINRVFGRAAESIAVEIETGSPHAGILEVAERIGAGLIVVGPGASALRVARAAGCPVLIARPSPAGGVIGATDFSDPAMPALRFAAKEAARRKTDLRFVHCLDIDETIVMPFLPVSMVDQLEVDARNRLLEAFATIGAKGQAEVVRHRPVTGIVESARTPPAALVVVGTRGRSRLSRVMLGSVAEGAISAAPCSVLVVPLHAKA